VVELESLSVRQPLRVGEPAPDFELPAVHRQGTVALAQYRGQAPVLLAMERGLYCPFCRRHLATLGGMYEKLKAMGVEALGIVGTPLPRAQLYWRHRPSPLPVVVDPAFTVHQSFGLPRFRKTVEAMGLIKDNLINPFGDLPQPRPFQELNQELSTKDPYEFTPEEQAPYDNEELQSTGQFLIDRNGIVRWSFIEGAQGLATMTKYSTEDDLLAAVRTLG